ncbi:hypothetical protein [Alicyclobacillus tolerans]|uniref:Uncharacterized protein n=1 Tax=Alicyclobacillus tolerans TaxID=90970 RepID=A0ABT9LZZ7_9BACL|nr:hypothetical protein [Alicyclobacillus tengchongensis]MDP9729696.1 hypothetical protein [Alicyclobacillus tengchongensis]
MTVRKEQNVHILARAFEGTQSIEDVLVMFLTIKEDGDFDEEDGTVVSI